MSKEIIYDCRWSDQLSSGYIEDFLNCVNQVFGDDTITPESFKKKYLDNIYGPSLITIVYIDGVPSAVDAMWRNDIGGVLSYQTVDTCTKENCRGLGIFRNITTKEVEILGEQMPIYGYPNSNSFPGYKKFGWRVYYFHNALFNLEEYQSEWHIDMDYDFAKWWYKDRKSVFYIQKQGQYFIVSPSRYTSVIHIIAKVDERTALLFPKWNKKSIILYNSFKKRWYNLNKKASPIVARGSLLGEIPGWKADF